jgi:hypothetical protein
MIILYGKNKVTIAKALTLINEKLRQQKTAKIMTRNTLSHRKNKIKQKDPGKHEQIIDLKETLVF